MTAKSTPADATVVNADADTPGRKPNAAAAQPGRSPRPTAPVAAKPRPAAAPAVKPPSKSAIVLKLLGRTKGATIAEMAEPTGWQPHSTRAYLSGLRKKGVTVTREPRRTGESAYRIVGRAGAALPVTVSPDGAAATTANSSASGTGTTAAEVVA